MDGSGALPRCRRHGGVTNPDHWCESYADTGAGDGGVPVWLLYGWSALAAAFVLWQMAAAAAWF